MGPESRLPNFDSLTEHVYLEHGVEPETLERQAHRQGELDTVLDYLEARLPPTTMRKTVAKRLSEPPPKGEPPKFPGSICCWHCGAHPVTLLHDGCPDSAGDVPEDAMAAQARRTARKRAESDVWVRAARKAGGGLLHQSRARFEGSAEFYRQDQMARNAAALTEGLEGLTEDVLRPNNLERLVAKAVVVTAGTKDSEVARALESGLRFGWVPAATRIRTEQTQIVDRLSRPMEPLKERERIELTERVYRMFPEDEIRAFYRGKGVTVDAVRDPEARSRLVENFRDLHAEPVKLPTPWRELQAEIAVSSGAARNRLQPERDLMAERNVISASM